MNDQWFAGFGEQIVPTEAGLAATRTNSYLPAARQRGGVSLDNPFHRTTPPHDAKDASRNSLGRGLPLLARRGFPLPTHCHSRNRESAPDNLDSCAWPGGADRAASRNSAKQPLARRGGGASTNQEFFLGA